ncbi:zona pellucida sperm-binding protein 4-like [Cynoglossus semilaevis]|uniref:zona pellucida sperm-binding protein 4-like n=1 Tax=Cynoglossus semilaevis TaxID=244447 RepID=UPI00049547D4|nr:zona pellucida sperm-binding protein 4-like [Cynoglossus semilaevis]
MAADITTFVFLLLLHLKCEAGVATKRTLATDLGATHDNSLLCLEENMSVYISKEKFPDLPLSIYVGDERGGFYQAAVIAKQCHYFLSEGDTFVNFVVSYHGCFVRRHKYNTVLTVVIMASAGRGRFEIVKSFLLICKRKNKEANTVNDLSMPRQYFCSKDGFNITITQNATVPPLNLDALWIPLSLNHNCNPPRRSGDSVTFQFPFTDCGTQFKTANGIITYSVDIEVKQRHQQNGSIFRDTPFYLTVQCSFASSQKTQLGVQVQGQTFEFSSTLKNNGTLRTEMRFAKDSSYSSFYSSHQSHTVIELGQPVYVEVFVVKHKDKDLVLLLDDCWATRTRNPDDLQRWSLLKKGCPFTADSHTTVVLPVVPNKELTFPSLHKRFIVQMFSFVNSSASENQVYFHCDVVTCKKPDCFHSCNNGGHKTKRIPPGTRWMLSRGVVFGGPLYLKRKHGRTWREQ